jgi:hypothetical protein
MPTCMPLSIDELLLQVSQGWTIAGGPYDSFAECFQNCGTSSSSSSTSSRSSFSSNPCCQSCEVTPSSWTLVVAGGSGVFSTANGTWTLGQAQIEAYSNCRPGDPVEWQLNTTPDASGNWAEIHLSTNAVCNSSQANSSLFVGIWTHNSTGAISGSEQYNLNQSSTQAVCCGTFTLSYIGGYTPPGSGEASTVTLTGNCP